MKLNYNLEYTNNTNTDQPLKFNTNLDVPFIKDPSEYQMTIIRFNFSNFSTPIFIFKDNTYAFTMSYGSNSATVYVSWISRDSTTSEHHVYELQHMVDMMNNCLNLCWTQLNSLSLLPTSDVPYFILNDGIIAYVANKTYYNTALPTPIKVYCNNALFKFIQGIPVSYSGTSNQEYQLLLYDTHDNTYNTNYYIMTQETNNFGNCTDLDSIVLTSSMPIQQEYIGSGSPIQIVTDFVPIISSQTYYDPITYTAVFPYRNVDMNGHIPLSNINITVYWKSKDGTLHQFYVSSNTTSSVKLMFETK